MPSNHVAPRLRQLIEAGGRLSQEGDGVSDAEPLITLGIPGVEDSARADCVNAHRWRAVSPVAGT